MEQESLFSEDIESAITAAVTAMGGSKDVGSKLWPMMDPSEAGKKLARCINRDCPDKLSLDEFLWIRREAKRIGCHTIAAFENQDAGYAPPLPIEPKDEQAELYRKFIENVRYQKRIADRIEELLSPVRAIK